MVLIDYHRSLSTGDVNLKHMQIVRHTIHGRAVAIRNVGAVSWCHWEIEILLSNRGMNQRLGGYRLLWIESD